jgi:uncharacterized protein (DUF488 family)
MRVYTIGYGGRTPKELQGLLMAHGVRTIVDIRLRPDRASMGCWTKAKTPDKGIERVLGEVGVGYRSVVELGNPFLGHDDWPARYSRLIASAGELLVEALAGVPEPYCLLCAEKRASECHRSHVADFLRRTRGCEVVHIE